MNPLVSLQGALAAANIAALMGAPDSQGAALKAWECHGGYEVNFESFLIISTSNNPV